jgi:hypothetical protein
MSSIAFPCPTCGQPYQLDYNYLTQYGGQATVCGQCQHPMTLPTLAQAGMMPAAAPTAYPPPAGGQWQAAQPAVGVLGYAGPQRGTSSGVFRDGNLLVVADGSELPAACVKCGQPAHAQPFRRTFYWHQPAIYLTIFAGVLVYVIVALCVRKSATIRFSMCDGHRASRRNGMIAGAVLALFGVFLFFAYGMDAFYDFRGGLIPFGILSFIVGLIVAALSSRSLSPQKIENRYIAFTGVSKRFLAQLPDIRQAQAAYAYAHAAQNANASYALGAVTE